MSEILWRIRGEDIILKPDVREDKQLASGIIVPGRAQKRPCTGVIVMIGPGLKRPDGTYQPFPPEITVGQRVVYHKFSQIDIELDGEDYELIDAGDVIALCDADDDIYQQKRAWMQ